MDTDCFIPALKELHQASPLELFDKLMKINSILANAKANDLLAVWHTIETATKLCDFTSEQMVVINEMRMIIKRKAESIRESVPVGKEYYSYKALFRDIIEVKKGI